MKKRTPGCLSRVFLGDGILPSFAGIMINHCWVKQMGSVLFFCFFYALCHGIHHQSPFGRICEYVWNLFPSILSKSKGYVGEINTRWWLFGQMGNGSYQVYCQICLLSAVPVAHAKAPNYIDFLKSDCSLCYHVQIHHC